MCCWLSGVCVCLPLPHVLPTPPISWVPPTSTDRRCHVFLREEAPGLLSAQSALSVPPLLCSLPTSRAMRPGGGSGRGGRGLGRRDRSSGMRSGGSRPRTTSSGRGRGSGSGRGMARASGRLGPMTAGPAGVPPAPTATAAPASSSPAAAATTASSFSFRPNPRPRPSSRGAAGSSCRKKEGMRGARSQAQTSLPPPSCTTEQGPGHQRAGKRHLDRERSL